MRCRPAPAENCAPEQTNVNQTPISQDKGRITLVPIAATDVELVAGILAASGVKPPWSAPSLATFMGHPGVQGLIAHYGDQPAGVLLYRHILGEAEVLTLGVTKAYRRRGIARALLVQAHADIEGAGGGKVFLEVAANNNGAVKLYKSLGYVALSTRLNYYQMDDYCINAEVFCKSLIKKQ